MDAPKNQPTDKESRRRTEYVLYLKQKERAEFWERVRTKALFGFLIVGFAGFIWGVLTLTTTVPTKQGSRPAPAAPRR